MSQSEAKNYVQSMLAGRGIRADFGIVEIGEEPWQVFEYHERCIAIDPRSGVWVGPRGGEWKCIGPSCTVSTALEAIEALIKDAQS